MKNTNDTGAQDKAVRDMLLGWLKGDHSEANIERQAKWAARNMSAVGGLRFFREQLRTAIANKDNG